MNCLKEREMSISKMHSRLLFAICIMVFSQFVGNAQASFFNFQDQQTPDFKIFSPVPSHESVTTDNQGFPWELMSHSILKRPKQSVMLLGTREYGWFCKAEWKLEKQTKLPLRIRLGSLQEANRLEGK